MGLLFELSDGLSREQLLLLGGGGALEGYDDDVGQLRNVMAS